MKAIVKYNDKVYLMKLAEDYKIDYDRLFDAVNEGRWPDECHYKEWIIERSEIVAYFTDESALVS